MTRVATVSKGPTATCGPVHFMRKYCISLAGFSELQEFNKDKCAQKSPGLQNQNVGNKLQ